MQDGCLPLSIFCFCVTDLWWFPRSKFVYLKKEEPTFAGWRRISYVGYQESTCWSWHPGLLPESPRLFWFEIFIMEGILWLYRTQGLFKICTSDTDVTLFSWVREFLSGSHIKTKKTNKNKEDSWINLISSCLSCRWVASSFPTEVFDPDRWPVGFIHLASSEERRWPSDRFTHRSSHQPLLHSMVSD